MRWGLEGAASGGGWRRRRSGVVCRGVASGVDSAAAALERRCSWSSSRSELWSSMRVGCRRSIDWTSNPSSPIPMEVEIKLRLPDAAAHRRLASFLAPRLLRTDAQRNLFFDASARPLAAATAALRVRLYGLDDHAPSRAVLALKRRASLHAGVSRVEEVEEPLDPALALACVRDPARLGSLDSDIIRLVSREYGVGGLSAPFVSLGGFRNTRGVYQLDDAEGPGLVLELDETHFDFGTNYELECETAEPDQTKEVLERLLTLAGVPYEYSRSNKFGCFMAGKLLP